MTIATDLKSESVNPPLQIVSSELLSNASAACKKIYDSVQPTIERIKKTACELFFSLQQKVDITPLSPLIVTYGSICSETEKIFNIAGCVPGIGFLSGSLRILLGKLQVITGIATVAISEVGRFLSSQTATESNLGSKWITLSKLGLEHTIHGCLNILRGSSEVVIGSYTFGLGNILFVVPNMANGRNFTPFFPYGSLAKPIAVDNHEQNI